MNINPIYAAIAGDIAGSRYEAKFPGTVPLLDDLLDKGHFTDDTVLTIAVADALMHKGERIDWSIANWAERYPHAGYSKNFKEKIIYPDRPEFGTPSSSNGAIMMLSPFLCFDNTDRVFEAVNVTHNCVLARQSATEYIESAKGFEDIFTASYDEFAADRMFDLSAYGTLQRAVACTGSGQTVSAVIEKAILLGGDTDTTACVAAAYQARRYEDSFNLDVKNIRRKLTGEMLEILNEMENA